MNAFLKHTWLTVLLDCLWFIFRAIQIIRKVNMWMKLFRSPSKRITFTMLWLYTFSVYTGTPHKAIFSLYNPLYACYEVVTKDLPNTFCTISYTTYLWKHFFQDQFHELIFHTPPLKSSQGKWCVLFLYTMYIM